MPSVLLGIDVDTEKEVRIGDLERRSGLYILGKSGMGKSSIMVHMQRTEINNNHGLFFLDPHGDAILDLLRQLNSAKLDRTYLFDPEDEDYSFGINLLHCPNVKSLKARTDTYTRAYNVFSKLWEDQFGPWLQLILQNILWAFIENQDYTLAEVPMFLNPRNEDFRNHIINNVKYSPGVADFWRYEFFDSKRGEQRQQERVDAALTRINTLLTHPYVRHIIGQEKTTVDFEKLVSSKAAWLFRLSSNLAPDIKKFIGTILTSELVHAVRGRPEGNRPHFSVFIDEFQNFASGENDMDVLVTEGRKYGVATTFAHVERFGQLAKNQKLIGATQAMVNKVLFQLTVADAEELAPEFAAKSEEAKTHTGGELILSPHPVEDIWDRGHTDNVVMDIRSRFFWVIDLLRSKPNESYYVFDPARVTPSPTNGGKLHYDFFNDWDMYRTTPDMLRRGISLLNEFYYRRMTEKPCTANNKKGVFKTDKELRIISEAIHCFSGVFGWRPTMEPYVPMDMCELFVRRINEHQNRAFRDSVQEVQRINRGREEDYAKWDRANPFRQSHTPRGKYWGDLPMSQSELEKIIQENKPEEFKIYDIPNKLSSYDINILRSSAITIGFTQGELDQLIQWKPRTLIAQEERALAELIEIVAHAVVDEPRYNREQKRINRSYTSVMALTPMVEKFGKDINNLSFEEKEGYLRIVTERIVWQMTELQHFIILVCSLLPMALEKYPVQIPSTIYDEAPKRERTQREMIDVMAHALSSLPRFTAFVKTIDEADGQQVVKKYLMQTLPLQKVPRTKNVAQGIINGRSLCKKRDEIEAEIRERQRRWLPGSGGFSPSRRRE
jgi:hypothetical protein